MVARFAALLANGITIAQLAGTLTGIVHRQVIDKTGLSGNYDVDLKWTPDNVGRSPQSSTDAPVETLKIGTHLEVVEPQQTHGFLHVKTEDGTQGWVWSRNIHVETNAAAGAAEHVGPANLYPDPDMTPGLAATIWVTLNSTVDSSSKSKL